MKNKEENAWGGTMSRKQREDMVIHSCLFELCSLEVSPMSFHTIFSLPFSPFILDSSESHDLSLKMFG